MHGELANAGHRVLAPDDAEVEAYLETALNAPAPERPSPDLPGRAAWPGDGTSRDEPDTVVVLDFGSQYAQLIARRVRELHVYSELLPFDTPWPEIAKRRPRAIILSGGPSSVYEAGAPRAWQGSGAPGALSSLVRSGGVDNMILVLVPAERAKLDFVHGAESRASREPLGRCPLPAEVDATATDPARLADGRATAVGIGNTVAGGGT